jgi:hypothetical protein
MSTNELLITQFYEAFRQKNYKSMQQAYNPDAVFSDPVFRNLSSREVQAMWQMLITSGSDLKIVFSNVKADERTGSCHWEAWYTFTSTGRKVHNIIDATFEFKDGKIIRHTDHFNFWRWSRQALGMSGLLLGWTPIVLNKVRTTARKRLESFMANLAFGR